MTFKKYSMSFARNSWSIFQNSWGIQNYIADAPIMMANKTAMMLRA